MLNIAFIDEDLSQRTGSRRFTYNVASRLQKLGHEVHIMTTRLDKQKCFKEYLSLPVEVVSKDKFSQGELNMTLKQHKKNLLIDFGNNLSYHLMQANLVMELSRRASEMGCTAAMVHYHGEYWLAPYFYYLSKPVGAVYLNVVPPLPPPLALPFQELTLRIRMINRLTDMSPVGRWKELSLRKLSLFVLPSQYLLKQAKSQGMIGSRKAEVVPLGVNHFEFFPTGEEEPFALYVGRIHPHKSLELAILAMKNTQPNISLIIAGDVDERFLWYREKLIKLAAKVKIADRFEIIPFPPEHEIVRLMQRCSVFLFPSTIDTFGLVVLEAMACGKPVVACNRGGVPEVIGDASFCLEPSVRQWQKTVEKLTTDSTLRHRTGEKALERSASFSWENTTSRLLVAFNNLKRASSEAS